VICQVSQTVTPYRVPERRSSSTPILEKFRSRVPEAWAGPNLVRDKKWAALFHHTTDKGRLHPHGQCSLAYRSCWILDPFVGPYYGNKDVNTGLQITSIYEDRQVVRAARGRVDNIYFPYPLKRKVSSLPTNHGSATKFRPKIRNLVSKQR